MPARSLASDIYGLNPAPARHVSAPARQAIDFTAVPEDILDAAMQAYLEDAARGAPARDDVQALPAEAEQLAVLSIGCIGGIAIGALAPRSARSLALIGTGRQARAQLAAALRMRCFTDIRIYGRRPVAAAELAKAYARKLGFQLTVSATPEEAVQKADVVILATDSPEPVIDADWVAPQAHVTTVGPRLRNRHELPLGLARRARTVVSDHPAAIHDNPEHMLADHAALKRLTHLGRLNGRFNPDRNRGMTLFLTEGLPGADAAMIAAARRYLAQE